MKTEYLLWTLLPLLSALIGWVTNYIAVKMIFRPRQERRFLGFRFQGLIPRRRSELARRIGEMVETELVSHRDIVRIVKSGDFQAQLDSIIRVQIDRFLNEKLGGSPLMSMFLTGETVAVLKNSFMAELAKAVPGILDAMLEKVESSLDFKAIVQSRIEGFPLEKLESIVYTIASKELKAIEFFGAVLGFLIGLAQLLILVLGKRYG